MFPCEEDLMVACGTVAMVSSVTVGMLDVPELALYGMETA